MTTSSETVHSPARTSRMVPSDQGFAAPPAVSSIDGNASVGRTEALLNRSVSRVVIASTLGASATTALSLPWASPWSLCIVPWLLLPIAVLWCCILSLSWVKFKRRWHRRSMPSYVPSYLGPELALQVGCGAAVFLVGFYLSNVLLVDEPFDRLTVNGYVISLFAALGTIAFVNVLLRHSQLRPWLRRHSWRDAIMLFLIGHGVGLSIIDATALNYAYVNVHRVLGLLVLAICVAIARLVFTRGSSRTRASLAALTVAALLSSAVGWLLCPHEQVYRAIIQRSTVGRRMLYLVRRIADRDRDGFSPVLGGGDCDDSDARAFPLSTIGRDCLGWQTGPEARVLPGRAAGLTAVTHSRPRIIVLLTIDAFRCGFARAEGGPPELAMACPMMTATAREGRARFDAHTPYPSTLLAMEALHTGTLHSWDARKVHGPALAVALSQYGYHTQAVVTHRRLLENPVVRESFAAIDDSLVSVARQPSATTSEAVTDHVLAHLRATDTSTTSQFIWAHYYDPHAPYVETIGSHWSISAVDAYAREVRRTDAAIGRLLTALQQHTVANDIFVLITADHGEEFGEHGANRHGLSLYESAVRIPVIAWSGGANHRRYGGDILPSTTTEIFGYLTSLVAERPFEQTHPTVLTTDVTPDLQLGLIEQRWKLIYHRALNYVELYDLNHDPGEHFDLSQRAPERVRALGSRLAHVLSTSGVP